MSSHRQFDVESVRQCFPLLAQQINGHPLVYLDNAATTQKPQAVLDALVAYYRNDNANVHRGVMRRPPSVISRARARARSSRRSAAP